MLDFNRKLSVAPMMDWTDRHCRYFHRQFSRHTLLYTEMVTAMALIHGDADRLLAFDTLEHPVALQIGGSDPVQLAQATKMGCATGYKEVNLNIGCPSDKVQSGRFGACLMQEPDLVADCLTAMQEASSGAEVTVKCRIGVDDQDPEQVLPAFVQMVSERGIKHISIHARKAWLQGLSPKENRDIPPLNYPLVHQIKSDFPDLNIAINGGISILEEVVAHIKQGVDGVMVGRAAYHNPAPILGLADRVIFQDGQDVLPQTAVTLMLPYIETELASGQRLNQITRHMLGAFTGLPGARMWRRILSENAHKPGAGPELIEHAMASILKLAT